MIVSVTYVFLYYGGVSIYMTTRSILAILVAALTLTAGCVGGIGGDGGDGADGTTTAGSGNGDGPVADDPEAVLNAAGSFTSEWRTTYSDDRTGESTQVGYTYAVDAENERYLMTLSSTDEGGVIQYYYADGTTYMKIGEGEDAFYQSVDGQTFDLSGAYVTDTYYYSHHDEEWMERVGTETFDGVTVTRYEGGEGWANRVNNPGDGQSGYTVSSSNYVSLVDADGIVRYDTWSLTMASDDGEKTTWTWEASVTGIGTTTVEEPDWIELAKSQGTPGN